MKKRPSADQLCGRGPNCLLAAAGADDLVGNVLRSFSVMLELHGVRCTALGLRTQAGRITEHLGQGNLGLDDLATTRDIFHALDHATARGQIAHHVAGVFFRRFHFNSHHRLEQHRACLAHAFLEGHGSGHTERVFVRVHIVVRTEEQRDLDVNNRVTSHHTSAKSFLDAFVDCRDVLARNHAALDGVDEFVTAARLERLELEHDVTVLTTTAGLFDELAFDFFASLADGFAVSPLRLADVGFHTELTTHAVDQNFQVELAHAGDNGLAGFFVGGHTEGRIFLSQTGQCHTHLFLVGLGLGFNGLGNHGLGEFHLLEQDMLTNVAQGFTRGDVLQAHHSGDVTCQNFLDFLTVVGVHLQDAVNTFFLALDRVVHGFASVQNTGVHTYEGQLTDEGIGHQLESQSGELRAVVGGQADGIAVVVHTFDRRNVDRGRQVIDDRVEHALNALVLERGATQHGLDFISDGAQTQTLVNLGFGEFTGFEILVHQVFVGFSRGFDKLFAPFFSVVSQFGRNVDVVELGALAGFVPDDGLHLDEVNHTLEGVFRADGQHDGYGVGLQTQLELVVHLEEVGAGTVHLVDKRETGHTVLVGLTPNGFRLRLHATHGAINHHGAVEHAHGTLNFNGEVHVS